MEKFASGTVDGCYPRPVAPSNEADMYAAYDTALFEAEAGERIYMNMWLSAYYEGGAQFEANVADDTNISSSTHVLILDSRTPVRFRLGKPFSYYTEAYSWQSDTLQGLVAVMREGWCKGTFNVQFRGEDWNITFRIVL